MNKPPKAEAQNIYNKLIDKKVFPPSVSFDKFYNKMQDDSSRQQFFTKLQDGGIMKKEKSFEAFSQFFINNEKEVNTTLASAVKKADEYDIGVLGNVGKRMEGGFKELIGGVAKFPDMLMDVSQSAAEGILRPIMGDKVDDRSDYARKMNWGGYDQMIESDYMKELEADAEELSEYGRKKMGGRDSFALLKDQEYAKAAESVLYDVSASIPGLVGTALTGGYGLIAQSGAAASNKYKELQKDGHDTGTSFFNAMATGAAELIFEKIGLDNVITPVKKMILGQGDGVKDQVKRGILNRVGEVIKASGIEGGAEFMTQFTENLTDVLSGVKEPQNKDDLKRMLLEGTGSAAMAGGAMGSGMRTLGESVDALRGNKPAVVNEKVFKTKDGNDITIKGAENVKSFEQFVKSNPENFIADENKEEESADVQAASSQDAEQEGSKVVEGKSQEDNAADLLKDIPTNEILNAINELESSGNNSPTDQDVLDKINETKGKTDEEGSESVMPDTLFNESNETIAKAREEIEQETGNKNPTEAEVLKKAKEIKWRIDEDTQESQGQDQQSENEAIGEGEDTDRKSVV